MFIELTKIIWSHWDPFCIDDFSEQSENTIKIIVNTNNILNVEPDEYKDNKYSKIYFIDGSSISVVEKYEKIVNMFKEYKLLN